MLIFTIKKLRISLLIDMRKPVTYTSGPIFISEVIL